MHRSNDAAIVFWIDEAVELTHPDQERVQNIWLGQGTSQTLNDFTFCQSEESYQGAVYGATCYFSFKTRTL